MREGVQGEVRYNTDSRHREKVTDSDFLTGKGAQYNYRYIQVAKTILMLESSFAPVKSLDVDDGGSESLSISYFNNSRLYTARTKEELIFMKIASNFVKVRIRSAPFRASTLHADVKTFPKDLRAVLVRLCTVFSGASLEMSSTPT